MTVDPAQLKKTQDIGLSGITFCVARKPNSETLYLGNSDARIYAIDLAAEKPEATPFGEDGHSSYVTSAVIAGDMLVSGSYDRQLIWRSLETGAVIRKTPAHDLWIRKLAVSPDGSFVVSVADDMHAKVWSTADGALVRTLDDHQPLTPHHYPSMLYAVAISPDGKLIATGDKVGHVAIWESATGQKFGEVEAPVMYTWDPKQRRHSIGGIRSLAFSHDSQKLAVGGIGTIGNIDHLGGPHRIEVFDWQRKERLLEISSEKHKGLVEKLQWDPQGRWLAAAGGDNGGFVAFYKADSTEELKLEAAPMHVHDFEFSDDFKKLYTVGHGKLAVWELAAAEPAVEVGP